MAFLADGPSILGPFLPMIRSVLPKKRGQQELLVPAFQLFHLVLLRSFESLERQLLAHSCYVNILAMMCLRIMVPIYDAI